jgi:ribosome-interacting GTPase 1
MATNLSPEYREAEQKLKQARTAEEKVAALRLMLSRIPKHKGTEKLQADIKRRLSKLRAEAQQQERKRGFSIHVEREGAGQVAVLGPPNAGKSSLVARLTGVQLEVADYPFTTQRPHPAMMSYEDVQVQLVDLPPVSPVHTESWVPGIARNADLALVVFDASAPDALEQIEETTRLLEASKLRLVGHRVPADGSASVVSRHALFVGTRADLAGADACLETLREIYEGRLDINAVSAVTGRGIDEVKQKIFEALHVVRVYSKPPHHEPELERPFVLPAGTTLLEFAGHVHRDFLENLKFARVWGAGKFDGQRVNKDYEVQDRDVIELHA